MSDYFRPSVTCDAIVFSHEEGKPVVLVIERSNPPYKGQLAFPGGFLDEGESCEECAARELEEETSLKGVDLKQLQTFSTPGRDPRGPVISIAFTGRVEPNQMNQAIAGDDARALKWARVADLSDDQLAFDHGSMLRMALQLEREQAD